MNMKPVVLMGVCVAMATAPLNPAQAKNDLAKAAAAAALLGVGVAIFQNRGAQAAQPQPQAAQPQQQNQGVQKKAPPARSAAEVQAATDLQQALNYFGFDAGEVDGAPGKQTRSAVASYQATLGAESDGAIKESERDLLMQAMARAKADPAAAQRLAAANPLNMRGLPKAYRDNVTAPSVPVAAPPPVAIAAAPAVPAAGMPSFGVATAPSRSINTHCNQISALTTTNGGYVTAATLGDNRDLAMNEQFCLARTYAIADGSKAAESVGASQEQISAQCGQLKSFLGPKISNLSSQKPSETVGLVRAALTTSGQKPAETQMVGRICLSEGYRTDDAELSNVAAATLAAADKRPYSELLAHHLREGFGTAADKNGARNWMTYALESLREGDPAVFLPGQAAERLSLLTAASTALTQ